MFKLCKNINSKIKFSNNKWTFNNVYIEKKGWKM